MKYDKEKRELREVTANLPRGKEEEILIALKKKHFWEM